MMIVLIAATVPMTWFQHTLVTTFAIAWAAGTSMSFSSLHREIKELEKNVANLDLRHSAPQH